MSTPLPDAPSRLVVMGVSGVGKTAVGRALAHRLGVPFFDADDFHPPANVARMSAGHPLDDADRRPWLASLNALLRERPRCVLACSALRQRYRDALTRDVSGVLWMHLTADFDTIAARLASRTGHFMPAALLASQFDTLEIPRQAVTIDAARPLEDVVDDAMRRLRHGAV